MNVFISGVAGSGMWPLALMARDAGMRVFGSDRKDVEEGERWVRGVEEGILGERGWEDERLKDGDLGDGDWGNAGLESEVVESGSLGGGFLGGGVDKNEDVCYNGRLGCRSVCGVGVKFGEQDGKILEDLVREVGIDWYVHSSAVGAGNAEFETARNLGLKMSKRDEFIGFLVREQGLKMVAVAGTHGKTTTCGMLVWGARKLGIATSWLVGSEMSFAPAGHFEPGSEFLIYEADEYDRNFLHFWPWLAGVTTISFDHPDVYESREEYRAAFRQFMGQARRVVIGEKLLGEMKSNVLKKAEEGNLDSVDLGSDANLKAGLGDEVKIGWAREGVLGAEGTVLRENSGLAEEILGEMMREIAGEGVDEEFLRQEARRGLEGFPGVGRRFEEIAPGIYSDYAHHPEEIQATLGIARAKAEESGMRGVVAVYQPHQNARQHEVFAEYAGVFEAADKVFWLPTFLTREPKELRVIEPEEFVRVVKGEGGTAKGGGGRAEEAVEGRGATAGEDWIEVAEMGEELAERVRGLREAGYLVILLAAGSADGWWREVFG